MNAPTTYSVSLAKKGMRVISNGEEIKGNPSSGLVPRKSVNPSDKASSPIDRQQGSMVGYEIIFKLSLVEPVGKERIIQSSEFSPNEITRETTDATFHPSIPSRKGREGRTLLEARNFTKQRSSLRDYFGPFSSSRGKEIAG